MTYGLGERPEGDEAGAGHEDCGPAPAQRHHRPRIQRQRSSTRHQAQVQHGGCHLSVWEFFCNMKRVKNWT